MSKVYCIPQVINIEDELERCCNIKSIDDLLGTSGSKEFKRRLIIEKNLEKKIESADFDVEKLWSKAPIGLFKDIPNDSDKIKISCTTGMRKMNLWQFLHKNRNV